MSVGRTSSTKISGSSIEKSTGIMLIVIGSFLIINGLPEGHEWYEETFVHKGLNELIELTPIPSEFKMDEHEHGGEYGVSVDYIPILLVSMISIPIIWYSIQRKREKIV